MFFSAQTPLKHPGRAALALSLLILAAASAGCSKEAVWGSAYESMRYKSNQQNAQDPNYDPDGIEEYGEYKAKRDQYLEDRREQDSR